MDKIEAEEKQEEAKVAGNTEEEEAKTTEDHTTEMEELPQE